MRRRRYGALAGFAAGFVLVIWFGLISRVPGAVGVYLPDHADLVEHALAFCWLSFTGLLAWRRPLLVICGLVVLAGLLEVLQMAIPLHEAHWVDGIASITGALVGWVFWLLACRFVVRRQLSTLQDGTR